MARKQNLVARPKPEKSYASSNVSAGIIETARQRDIFGVTSLSTQNWQFACADPPQPFTEESVPHPLDPEVSNALVFLVGFWVWINISAFLSRTVYTHAVFSILEVNIYRNAPYIERKRL